MKYIIVIVLSSFRCSLLVKNIWMDSYFKQLIIEKTVNKNTSFLSNLEQLFKSSFFTDEILKILLSKWINTRLIVFRNMNIA